MFWSFASQTPAQPLETKVVVSYNASTEYGRANRDSVFAGMKRLEVPFDSIDRNLNDSLDYTAWQILVWASGDPNVPVVPRAPTGQAGLSAREIQEVEQFLQAGTDVCQKKLVMAGQNIAYEHGSLLPNGAAIDTTFLEHWLHVRWIANAPKNADYQDWIDGALPAYWKYPDSIASASPDVIMPSFATPLVGPEVTGFAYTYRTHQNTPADSGAGTTYYNPDINTVFYAFDWADPLETTPGGFGDTTSGTTRTLAAAFAFFRSHGGNLPCASTVTNTETQGFAIAGIYPNPASNEAEIQLSLDGATSVSVRLVDATGRVLLQTSPRIFATGKRTMKLNLHGIPSGLYICSVRISSFDSSTEISRRLSILR